VIARSLKERKPLQTDPIDLVEEPFLWPQLFLYSTADKLIRYQVRKTEAISAVIKAADRTFQLLIETEILLRFPVLTAVVIRGHVFWDMLLCSSLKNQPSFWRNTLLSCWYLAWFTPLETQWPTTKQSKTEECWLVGYGIPVCTSQETHYVSATAS
jgi:hypothetical protein